MKADAGTVDRIVSAAALVAESDGLSGLTVSKVAARAEVSSALVHYHFDTKQRLLVAAARRLAAARVDRRTASLKGRKALSALDALWDVVEKDAAGGAERAWLELLALAHGDRSVQEIVVSSRASERSMLAARLPAVLLELGAGTAPEPDEEEVASALAALLDGLAASLTAGEPPAQVRAAYDAFWLALIAAGQNAGGR